MRQRDEKKLLAKIQQHTTQQPTTSANTQQTKKIKQQLKRYKVEGADRLELFAKWIDLKSKEIAEAEAYLSDEKKQKIMKEMTQEGKISRLENEEKEKRFKQMSKGAGNRVVASKHFADVTLTPWMEGSIILSFLTKAAKARPYLMAEIKERGIKFPQPKTKLREMTATQREKYNKKWEGLNEMELRHILRDDERARLLKEEEKSFAKVRDVKYMKPLSKKMQEWKKEQWKIYKKKKGIVAEDNDDANT
jgi:hypothetical protein